MIAHARALELEDAHRLAAAEEVEGGTIVPGDFVQVEAGLALPDEAHGLVHQGQLLQPQDVHLQQAHILARVAVELRGDGAVLRRPVEGHVIGEAGGGDDDGAGVHRGVARQALQLAGVLDQLSLLAGGLRHLLQLRHLLNRLVEGDLQLPRDQLGDAVHLAEGQAQDPPHVADHRLGAHRAEGDHLGDVLLAVLLDHVAHDLVPARVGEVDVDVGRLDALGVEEALEEQVVADRVGVGDLQAVRDQAAGRRPAARTDGDAALAGVVHEVLDDQEVAGEALLGDHLQLVVEALLDLGDDLRVAALQAFLGEAAQVLVGGRELGGNGEAGHERPPEVQLHPALLGDGEGVLDRPGQVREELLHLRRALHVESRGIAHPFGIGQVLPRLDADQGVVGGVVVCAQEVEVVGGHQRHPELAVQVQEPVVDLGLDLDAVALDLQVVVVPEDLHVLPRRGLGLVHPLLLDQVGHLSGDACGHADKPLAVLPQELLVDARIVVEALGVPLGDELDQVLPARRVLGQQDEVVGAVGQAAGPGAVVAVADGHVDLAPEDRPDAGVFAGPVVGDGAEEVAVVGDGQGGHAGLGGGGRHGVDGAAAVEEAVLAVSVEVDELGAGHWLPGRRAGSQ